MENGTKDEKPPEPGALDDASKEIIEKPTRAIRLIRRLHYVRLMEFASEVGDVILLEPRPKPTDGYKHIFRASPRQNTPLSELLELVSFWRCVAGDLLPSAMKYARLKHENDEGSGAAAYEISKVSRREMQAHRRISARLLVSNGSLDKCLYCGKRWKQDIGANNEYVKTVLVKGEYKSLAKIAHIAPTYFGVKNLWWNFIPTCCVHKQLKDPKKASTIEELENEANLGLDFFPGNMLIGLAFWYRIMARDPYTRTRDLLEEENLDAYKDKLEKEKDDNVNKLQNILKTARDTLLFLQNADMDESQMSEVLEDLHAFIERTKKFVNQSYYEQRLDRSGSDKKVTAMSETDAALVKSLEDLEGKVKEAVDLGEDEDLKTIRRRAAQGIMKNMQACCAAIKEVEGIKRSLGDIYEAQTTVIPNLPAIIQDRQRRCKQIAFSIFVHVLRLLADSGYTQPQNSLDEDSLIHFVLGFFFVLTDPHKAIDAELPDHMDWRFLKLSVKEQAMFKRNVDPATW